MKIDPASTRIALFYTGNEAGEPHVSGVPARDLTENDIAWLVGRAHGDLAGAAFDKASDKLVDDLTAGPYRRTAPDTAKPSKAKKSAKTAASAVGVPPPTPSSESEPVTQPIEPATPASQPEE